MHLPSQPRFKAFCGSIHVNVLLNNCKQNITSLSLLVSATVHSHAMFHLQCVDSGYCLCGATAITDPMISRFFDSATGQLVTGSDCIIAPYTQDYGGGTGESTISRSIHYSYQLILEQTCQQAHSLKITLIQRRCALMFRRRHDVVST